MHIKNFILNILNMNFQNGAKTMVIINGKIFPMEGKNIENGYVRTKDKVIEDIGDMSSFQLQKNEAVLDVQGAWVLPGLIDAHVHIGITEEKWGAIADDGNEGTNPVTPTLRAIDAINPMDPAFHDAIEAGITSVMAGPGSANVVGGQFVFMKTQGRCIDNMIVKHPAAMKVAFGENPKALACLTHTLGSPWKIVYKLRPVPINTRAESNLNFRGHLAKSHSLLRLQRNDLLRQKRRDY
jgi:imidazolonepropionase-like amidohydrolase